MWGTYNDAVNQGCYAKCRQYFTMVGGQEAALNDLKLARVNSLLAQESHPASELALFPQNVVVLVIHAHLYMQAIGPTLAKE